MMRSAGNRKLKAARLAHGYVSQQAFAEALDVGVRQVRRWESEEPPWPQEHHQQRLRRVLGMDMEQLGFRPPWQDAGSPGPVADMSPPRRLQRPIGSRRRAEVRGRASVSVVSHFASITFAHRQMYWAVDPHQLHSAALEHVRLGEVLLSEATDGERPALASALAESALLVGRIEFFDLRQPDSAADTFTRALQFAGDANDSLLGSAILAHAAFVPGWVGDRAGASDRMAAARAYARRGEAPPMVWAWLDAVDAECATPVAET
jgi:transcriptional regulator with XRE-family HTH domain